jgi:hypothetical protein
MSTTTFIEQLVAGQAADAKETLSDLLSARAFEALDSRKQELGATLFGGQVEEGYDSSGAYEKHDPKHPDFVKNYKKYKATNPQGQLGDFVAHMKKQK